MERLARRLVYPAVWLIAAGASVWLYSQTATDGAAIGIVEAPRVEVSAPISGTIAGIEVVEGARVEPGQVLLRLETADLDVELDQLEAQRVLLDRLLTADRRRFTAERAEDRLAVAFELARIRRSMHEGLATVRSSSAELSGVEGEIKRIEGAVAGGAVAQQQLERLLTRRDALRAFLTEQRRAVSAGQELARSDNDADPADLDEDRLLSLAADRLLAAEGVAGELARVREARRQRTVTSPTRGRVLAVLSEAGESLPAFQTAVVIEQPEARFVDVFVPEGTELPLALGDAVDVRSDRAVELRAQGTVVVEGRSFDPLPARLQPVRAAPVYARHVRVQLPATHPLLPGERVHVDPRPP